MKEPGRGEGMEMRSGTYAFPDIIFDNMIDVLLILGVDARIVMTNPAIEELLGYREDELVGKPLGFIMDENDIELFYMIKGLISNGTVRNRALTCISRDGRKVPVDFNGSAMRDADGRLIGIVGLVRDMRDIRELLEALEESRSNLERKVQERTADLEKAKGLIEEAYKNLKLTQSQLLQSEKMASIGQLAAGVAHEINNPIGFINSNLGTLKEYVRDIRVMFGKYRSLVEMIKKEASGDCSKALREIEEFADEADIEFIMDDLANIVEESREGAMRVGKIVKDLKNFSHVDEEELKFADINRGIESTLNIVRNEIKYKAELVMDLGDIPEVECHPQQLNQVFMNLLVNACHAIEKQGRIGIRTYAKGMDRVCIEISDNGCGIPRESMGRIFEPFYTTKPVGQGTGLGLSMSYNIIKGHHGEIRVESEVGRGTTFSIELPVRYRGRGDS